MLALGNFLTDILELQLCRQLLVASYSFMRFLNRNRVTLFGC